MANKPQTLNDYYSGYTPFALPKIPQTPLFNDPNNLSFPVTTPNMMPVSRTLPNGGGTFSSSIPTPTTTKPVFTPPATPDIHPAYLNADGSLKTPGEVGAGFGGGTGRPGPDIPRYSHDQFTEGPQTNEQLQTTAAGLNNARNDIATGATDPYKVASQSGIAYSPAELKAIESAYAGVYDPAINSALSKLDTRQKEDAAARASKQRREEQIFATDENIRQWRATTGTTKGASNFSPTQTHKGAVAAAVDLDTFDGFSSDLKSYFVNMPKAIDSTTNKQAPLSTLILALLQEVADGTTSAEDVTNEIESLPITQDVKDYYLSQIPAHEAIKSGGFGEYFSNLVSAINPFD